MRAHGYCVCVDIMTVGESPERCIEEGMHTPHSSEERFSDGRCMSWFYRIGFVGTGKLVGHSGQQKL